MTTDPAARAHELLTLPRDLTEDESAEVKRMIRDDGPLAGELGDRWILEHDEVLAESD